METVAGGTSGYIAESLAIGDLSRVMNDLQKKYKGAEERPFPAIIDTFAAAWTAAIRQKASNTVMVAGTALGEETFVSARWGWAVLPVALVGLTCLFMTATLPLTIKQRYQFGKAQHLPLLLTGWTRV